MNILEGYFRIDALFVYWGIVFVLLLILGWMYFVVQRGEKERIKTIKQIRKGSYIFVWYNHEPTKVLVVHNFPDEEKMKVRLYGKIITVPYEDIKLEWM